MKRVISVLLVLILALSLSSCDKNNDLNAEDIHAICELATIKCYYNNIAKIEKKKDNIFQKDREMWIEYEGEAVIGIDMSKVEVDIKGETVRITLPEAEIFSINPNYETLNEKSYVCSADGLIIKNKITTEDQEEAIKKGQKEMEEKIKENKDLFVGAETKAKEIIGNYINQVSKLLGKEYKIVWKQ